MRTISEMEVRSIKSATEGSYVLGGGVSDFPEFTRVGISTLSKYASFNDEFKDTVIPCDVAIEADRRAKSPRIVSAMARVLGYRLVADDGGAVRGPVTEMDAHKVLSESMDLTKAILDALLDNRIDALERKRIVAEGREALRAIEQVLAKIEEGDGE
ncbi:phage regulatory CII family protein [Rhizobium sp. LEGMi198b]